LSYKVKSEHLNKIYQLFICPHFDYCDVLYNRASRKHVLQQLEIIHYNAGLSISGCIHGSSTRKVLSILNWQTLEARRKERVLIYMYKVSNDQVPSYVQSLFNVYKTNFTRFTRNPLPYRLPNIFSAKFLSSPLVIMMKNWNNVRPETRSLPTLTQYKKKIVFKYTNPKLLSTIQIKSLNRKEEICLNRLRVDLILKGHLYAHNFWHIPDPRCNHCHTTVSTKHFLLQCQKPSHKLEINKIINYLDTQNLITYFNNLSIMNKCNFLMYGDKNFTFQINLGIIETVAKFVVINYDKL